MRGATGPRGYTIVEVMIFLAISGFMFVIAAAFVSGKQATAEFRQGINDINTQVQQVINDVSNGFFPSNSDFTCTANSSGPAPGSGRTTQGANYGCIFLGKVIQFGAGNAASYNIYTVAGCQFTPCTTAGTSPNNLSDAEPTIISTKNNPFWHDLTQYELLNWGLGVTKMTSTVNGTASNIDAVGFFGSLSNYDPTTGNLESGSQSLDVVTFTGTKEIAPSPPPPPPPDETATNMISDIDSTLNAANPPGVTLLSNPDILICFDGGSGQ